MCFMLQILFYSRLMINNNIFINRFIAVLKKSINSLMLFIMSCLPVFFMQAAYADDGGFGREGVLLQLQSGFVIVETVSVIMGAALMVGALTRLKRYGEMRGNMMGSQQSAAGPILGLIVAIMLLSLPQCISILQTSLWGTSTPEVSLSEAAYNLKPVLVFVRLVGVITIMRGLLQLSRYTPEGGGAQGTIGKAVMHIIIGLCLAHIIGTARVINSVCGSMMNF